MIKILYEKQGRRGRDGGTEREREKERKRENESNKIFSMIHDSIIYSLFDIHKCANLLT